MGGKGDELQEIMKMMRNEKKRERERKRKERERERDLYGPPLHDIVQG